MEIKADPFGRVWRKDAAESQGVTVGTMANWATQGVGPKPYKTPTGGRVYYLASELREFALRGVTA